ncbi:hypothetical protein TD95_005399 [Thielaviopsis punctulata]|uniref:Uncharacterized protein n=1 Tax=Thielaviopsis punctulata TaxID=72032 RepID=A0A0F4ZCI1_9PEZI|nr:hypothetical protein TD95_005399 [Thielaviopsis punctulata]
MPPQLLPASAQAFAPRASSVNVVLGSKVEPWLTQTLKRINRVKRPLNSVPQHQRCLTETLSSPNAIWTLCSLILANAPEADLQHPDSEGNPLADALANYSMLHVEAYIVHVDMVLRNEVAFKLTAETIDALVTYHKDVHCMDAKANTVQWPEKDSQAKKLHDDFVQAVNKYVFRTPVTALEGLEEEGAGELLGGRAEEVKKAIFAMLKPLVLPPPPPPRVIDVVRRQPLLPSANPNISHNHGHGHAHSHWSQPTPSTSLPAVEPWRVLPSSTGVNQFDILPTTTSASVTSSSVAATASITSSPLMYTTAASPSPLWAPATMNMPEMGMAVHDSPPPLAHSQMIHQSYVPFTSAELFCSPQPLVSAPMTMATMPSMLAAQCGLGLGFNSFDPWESRYQEMPTM